MVASKTCGSCKLCCKLTEVPSLEKPGGAWCQHACSLGCYIYEKRPEECQAYNCLWIVSPNMTPRLRPDLCGVMFEPYWDAGLVLAKVERHGAWQEDPASVLILRLTNDGYPVIAIDGKEVHMCVPEGMLQEDVLARMAKLEEKRNDSSLLHN